MFPLVRFNVYTDTAAEDVSFTRLIGRSATGERILVEGDAVFASLQGGRFQSFHASLLEDSNLASIPERVHAPLSAVRDYRRFLHSVLTQYNEDHQPDLISLSVEKFSGSTVERLAETRSLRSRTLITVYSEGREPTAPRRVDS